MSDYLILKAVEHAKLPVKFRKTYPTTQSMVDAGWWVQEKYDGCMGVAFIDADRSKCRMQSRTGEDYSVSCEFILDELFEAANECGPDTTPCVVIGEVWQPASEALFPAISGKFRKRQANSDLKFIANDMLPPGLVTAEAYRIRFADLCSLLPPMSMTEAWCHVALTRHSGVDDVEAYALELQGKGGFDGAILRDPDSGYTIGTVKAGEIVKVKPTLSLDLRCNGVIQGEGKHEGRLGAVTVGYKGVNTAVGTGFSDEDREFMWKGATAPAGSLFAAHNPINRIVEIEALGITEDGKLREPRFKGIRFDKVKAD